MTVVCLGDVMTDVVAQVPRPLAWGSDTPSAIALQGGGSAANTACWLATLGVPVRLIGRVGDDALGRQALVDLGDFGIDLALTVDPTRPTGTCIVLVDAAGERTMIPDTGANAAMSADDLPSLTGVGWLHVSAYSLFSDGSRRAALAALERALDAGARCSVDAASAAPLRGFGAERFLRLLGPDVLLFANADEVAVLVPGADPAQAAARLSRRAAHVVVKRGADDAIWAHRGTTISVPVPRRDVVDSTGAGDAFAAGMIAATLAGVPPAEAVADGHATAARALGVLGGRPPTPRTGGRPPARR